MSGVTKPCATSWYSGYYELCLVLSYYVIVRKIPCREQTLWPKRSTIAVLVVMVPGECLVARVAVAVVMIANECRVTRGGAWTACSGMFRYCGRAMVASCMALNGGVAVQMAMVADNAVDSVVGPHGTVLLHWRWYYRYVHPHPTEETPPKWEGEAVFANFFVGVVRASRANTGSVGFDTVCQSGKVFWNTCSGA